MPQDVPAASSSSPPSRLPASVSRGRAAIAVVGGGFAGAAVVSHVAARATTPLHIVLYEPAERLGRGVAYGASGEHLLLNVAAGRLSLWPDKPGDFASWCGATGRPVAPGDFLPRGWFGEYAESAMTATLRNASRLVSFEHLRAEATGVRVGEDGALVVMDRVGGERGVSHVVLALGNGPPKVPPVFRGLVGDSRLVVDPFKPGAVGGVARAARRVLLVGVGLTMIDVALTLEREGFAGKIVAVSRRGVLPCAHGASNASEHAVWAAALDGDDLRRIARAVRTRGRAHEWRGVIDAMRPHTGRLWRAMNEVDRARFLDRLAVYWDAHRHRCPPSSAARVEAMRRRGALRVGAVEILSVHAAGETIDVAVREKRSGAVAHEPFDAVVLCTGPNPDIHARRSALIDSLRAAGLLCADRHGLGVACDTDGRLLGADGAPSAAVSAIGPLRKGEAWESTAAPEIAAQAEALAGRIVGGAVGRGAWGNAMR